MKAVDLFQPKNRFWKTRADGDRGANMMIIAQEKQILLAKWQKLLSVLAAYRKCAVCFSGGVDSGVLLYAAHCALGENVLALSCDSVALGRQDRLDIEKFIQQYHISHNWVEFLPLQIPEVRENPSLRCYYCKGAMLDRLWTAARAYGYGILLEGSNLDDLSDDRPGYRQVRAKGLFSPLEMIGFTKDEIYQLSEWFGLPMAGKPASACLMSRIASGEPIKKNILEKIDKGEQFLKTKGFSVVRIRYKQGIARIEVEQEKVPLLLADSLWPEIKEYLYFLGFNQVVVEQNGYLKGGKKQHR